MRPTARLAIMGAMAVIGVALGLAIAYRLHGSLEQFPTAEQEAKIRVVTTVLAAGLAIAEVGLWQLLRRPVRAPDRDGVSQDSTRPVA